MKTTGKKQKWIALSLAIVLHLEVVLPVYAVVTPSNGATVGTGVNNVPVVNIVAPNDKGLSHNQFTDLNVGKEGLVFNNAVQNAQTKLAGAVAANATLNGKPAALILAEVTGSRNTNLNGLMEVAGQKADLVIANPNGIVGNGFGFINVGRAVLTTGKPVITNGRLDRFDVQKGTVEIAGTGNSPYDSDGNTIYDTVNKLDIYAAAAKINGELWAKDRMHVVTGKNSVTYDTSEAARSFEASGTDVSLDVGALGGMYAGKIFLVGTNKGLGVSISGNIHADDELHITNNGKIVFQKGNLVEETKDGENVSYYTGNVYSGGIMDIDANESDIQNEIAVSASGSINITAGGKLTNSGRIIAGESYETNEGSGIFERKDANLTIKAAELENVRGIPKENESGTGLMGGVLDASNTLIATITGNATVGGQISAVNDIHLFAKDMNVTGSVYTEKGELHLSGTKVKYNKENLKAKDEGSIHITETDPDQPVTPPAPEPPRKADELATPDLPGTAGTAATKVENKADDSTLALTADDSADGKYKPIIDHTASGIDLVQIAEANANGVSRNLYTDFNIKSTGLILNNASKYAKTELGGYIVRNMRIAGNGARIILNEVTSSHASTLQGFLEVAGNKASVVIANANGISINGVGFINTEAATIAAGSTVQWAEGTMSYSKNKGQIHITGDGLDGTAVSTLSLVGNHITNNASEIYGNTLVISADGTLSNTGKTGAKNDLSLTAGNVENAAEGVIEAGRNLTAGVTGGIHQDKASIKAGNAMNITAGSLSQEGESLLSAGKEMDLSVNESMTNNQSTILSSGNMVIHAGSLTNTNSALLQAGGNLIAEADAITNTHSNIYIEGDSQIRAGSFTNTDESAYHTGGNLSITADSLTNTRSAIDIQKNMTGIAARFLNEDNGYFGVGGDTEITGNIFTNKSLGTLFFTGAASITETGDFLQEDGLMAGGKSIAVTAKNIYNQNNTKYKEGSLLSAAGNISLTAENTLHNRSSTITSDGDITIKAVDVVNDKEKFTTGWDVTYEYISYKIPHLTAPNYYDAMREFTRTIHTGVIKEETNDAKILASGNIFITADKDVKNHYSQIAAGKDLTVNAGGTVENIGYQGTIHHDDLGRDNHYWKYKKHRRFHIGCHWVYGTTVIPYEDHNVYDQDSGETAGSERLSVMSGVGSVKITAANTVNKTLEADGTQYEDREKKVSTDFTDKLTGNEAKNPLNANQQLVISQLQYNSRIYSMNKDPSAKYLIETDPRYANYRNFLSSDYLLERVKSDPEKVSKRLGDGYFEQQLVMQQILGLTGKKYLDTYGSDMDQFRALMESGAVAAEEMHLELGVSLTAEQVASLTSDIVWLVKEHINGQDILVPEVYLASVRKEDLKPSGALITGGNVALYSKQDIQNIGTISADRTVSLHVENVENKGGTIAGGDVSIEAENAITNRSGTISAKENVNLKAGTITNETATKTTRYKELTQTDIGNTAVITGKNVTLEAKENITDRGGQIAAGGDLSLSAGKNIDIGTVAKEKHVAIAYGGSSAELHSVQNHQSLLAGENVTLKAGEDVNLKGTLTSGAKDTSITTGRDMNMTAVKNLYSEESEVGHRGGNYYNHNKKVDETVRGTTVAGKENTAVTAGEDILIKGSSISTEKGKVSLNAGENIKIENETERHERLHEFHEKASGILSTKTTDIYDKSTIDQVVGSTISGGSVELTSKNDTTVKGSTVVGDGDIHIQNGGNFTAESADEVSQSEYMKQVKKSGLLAGGGLGITIGKEKQKDQYASQNIEQVGSTIGSVDGSVTISSDKNAAVKASDVIAGKDIHITGENVDITSKDSTYNYQEKHEYERSGLSISLGGTIVNTAQNVIQPLERAHQVEDKRLAALYGVKAGQNVKNGINDVELAKNQLKQAEMLSNQAQSALGKAEFGHTAGNVTDRQLAEARTNAEAAKENAKKARDNLVNLHIGIGSEKSKSETRSTTNVAEGSTVKAKGDVTITSTKEDINIHGSGVEGESVKLNAARDLNVTASENTNKTKEEHAAFSGSIGVTVGLGGVMGVDAGYSRGKENIKENSTTYNESIITAKKELTFESGKDTNIRGGAISGEKVTGKVGGDLNIESQQDSKDYESKSTSSGLGISYNPASGGVSVTGGASKGSIESRYDSVTSQSGIYAGKEGFDISVEKNTDLKGAVIGSNAPAEKNQLTTGTLTWEDTKNKAEYEAGGVGINVNTSSGAKLNEKGITPSITPTVKGDADSTTKSAVAEGTITIKDKGNQKEDIGELNRNMTNNLNKLGEIFDKDDAKERQELAGLFMQEAMGQLHYWNPDSAEGKALKAMAHGIVGEIAARIAGNQAGSGFYATMTNEALIGEIHKIATKDPALAQWISAMIGSAINKGLGKDAQVGGSTAQAGTKWNLELNEHAEEVRSSVILEQEDRFYESYMAKRSEESYSIADGEKAIETLAEYHDIASSHITPVAKDLLGLFLDQNPKDHGIINEIDKGNGYKIYEFGDNSIINKELRNNDSLNRKILDNSIREVINSGQVIPTYVDSYNFYTTGIDSALGLGRATAITSFRFVDGGRSVEAKITIMDDWDHSADFSNLGSFYKDAYIAQQSGVRPTYGYKTTYDIKIDIADLFPNMEYES